MTVTVGVFLRLCVCLLVCFFGLFWGVLFCFLNLSLREPHPRLTKQRFKTRSVYLKIVSRSLEPLSFLVFEYVQGIFFNPKILFFKNHFSKP